MTGTAAQIIAALDLRPHPEGGWYRQTWIAKTKADERPSGTAIYYLLERGQTSHWHRVDAVEIWHYYAGDPLVLALSETDEGPAREIWLGSDLSTGHRPQVIVPE